MQQQQQQPYHACTARRRQMSQEDWWLCRGQHGIHCHAGCTTAGRKKAAAASPCRCTIKLQVWTRHQQATDVLAAVYLLALCSVRSALQYAAYERCWAQKVQHLAVALTAIMSGQGGSSPVPDLEGLVMHEKPFYI